MEPEGIEKRQREMAEGRRQMSQVLLTVWLILPFVVIGVLWLLIDPEAMRKHRAEMEAQEQRLLEMQSEQQEVLTPRSLSEDTDLLKEEARDTTQ